MTTFTILPIGTVRQCADCSKSYETLSHCGTGTTPQCGSCMMDVHDRVLGYVDDSPVEQHFVCVQDQYGTLTEVGGPFSLTDAHKAVREFYRPGAGLHTLDTYHVLSTHEAEELAIGHEEGQS